MKILAEKGGWMKDVTRNEYLAQLDRLPIVNPSPADIIKLCPHLDLREGVEALVEKKKFIAMPPVLVRNGYLVLQFSKTFCEEGIIHPPKLNFVLALRTRSSYKENDQGDIYLNTECMEKAMRYAELHWGSELILDSWDKVVRFCIQDPKELNNDGFPNVKFSVMCALSKMEHDSIANGEQINSAIMKSTLNRYESEEMKGNRNAVTFDICAQCGSGLGLTFCTGCGIIFEDDGMRKGCSITIPKKVEDTVVKLGHEFKIDPATARALEEELAQRRKNNFYL